MVIRWFIGLVLLCLSLVAQGRAYTYEAINEQSRSSKEYSLKLKISQVTFDLGKYTNLKKAYTGFQSQLGSGYTTFENALRKCNNDVLTAFDENTALFNKLGNIKDLGETELAEIMAKVSKGEDFGQLKVGNNLVGVQGAGNLAKNLTGFLKSSYDDLLTKGFTALEEAGKIKFLDNTGRHLAEISNGKLIFKYGGFGADVVITEGKATTVLGKLAEEWTNPNSFGTRRFLGSNGNPVVQGFPNGAINRGVGSAVPNRLNFLDLPEPQYNSLINTNIKSELETVLGSTSNINLASKSIDEVKNLIKSSHPKLSTTQINNIIDLGKTNGNIAFWNNYNLPFLEQAFQRGDDIRLVSDPAVYQFDEILGGTYKKELDAIMGSNGLAQKYGYTYNSTTKTFIKQ